MKQDLRLYAGIEWYVYTEPACHDPHDLYMFPDAGHTISPPLDINREIRGHNYSTQSYSQPAIHSEHPGLRFIKLTSFLSISIIYRLDPIINARPRRPPPVRLLSGFHLLFLGIDAEEISIPAASTFMASLPFRHLLIHEHLHGISILIVGVPHHHPSGSAACHPHDIMSGHGAFARSQRFPVFLLHRSLEVVQRAAVRNRGADGHFARRGLGQYLQLLHDKWHTRRTAYSAAGGVCRRPARGRCGAA